jgi:flagellar basal-body rod protein FlgF
MDRLIYLAMAGAKHLFARQDSLANNLANANTTGYRAQQTAFRVAPVQGQGLPTRAFAVESTPVADFAPGVIQQTGRNLDVAVNGRGWIAVQGANGEEGYTRAGAFDVAPDGTLVTRDGLQVMGEGSGPISIPPDARIAIAEDGTVSAINLQPPLTGVNVIGRIKLVNPPEASLERSADGLFRVRGGDAAELDPNVRVIPGSLEGSNVNVVEAMIGVIAAARQFEMHMKMLQTADANARSSDQLLTTS